MTEENKNNVNEPKVEATKEVKVETDVSEVDTLNKKIEALALQVKTLEDKVLYKDAELINYRKRKDDEVSSMLKYANVDIVIQILTIVDDLERAISFDDNVLDDEVSKFLSGIKMTYSRLLKILSDFEVKEIEALDKPFDPTYHQAVFTAKDEKKESGIVLEVLQKGYMYKDKVIRPSMVKVSE